MKFFIPVPVSCRGRESWLHYFNCIILDYQVGILSLDYRLIGWPVVYGCISLAIHTYVWICKMVEKTVTIV